ENQLKKTIGKINDAFKINKGNISEQHKDELRKLSLKSQENIKYLHQLAEEFKTRKEEKTEIVKLTKEVKVAKGLKKNADALFKDFDGKSKQLQKDVNTLKDEIASLRKS